MTRVVHLLNFLSTSGNAALRLHESFVNNGIDSSILSLSSAKPESTRISSLGMKGQIKSIINGRIQLKRNRNLIEKFGMFSYPTVGNNISNHKFIQKSDIIYIHWAVGGFLSFKNFEQLAKLNKPIIIFMHDMWHITGGCHYSFDCTNFIENCNACQMFPEKNPSLPIKGFQKKLGFYRRYENLTFVAPSTWLTKLAMKSGLTKDKPVYHIPNVIDSLLFKPFDKKAAREILGLDENETLICFGAVSPKSPYKGWSYLKESLEILAEDENYKNICIVIFGSEHDEEIANAIPFKTKFLGRFYDDLSTSLVYNAVDVFMAPSLADNLPTTVMESLCCGTPVVGFDNGGIPDMIEHKRNGYLARYKDAQDLSSGIKFCLKEEIQGYNLSIFETKSIIETHKKLHAKLLPSY